MQPNEAMKAMAKRIADETIPEDADGYATRGAWENAWHVARDAALAAIEQATEHAALFVETFGATDVTHGPAAVTRFNISTAIRTGEHYALQEVAVADPVFTTLDAMRDWFRIEQRQAAMQDYFGHPDMHRRTVESLERVRATHAHLLNPESDIGPV